MTGDWCRGREDSGGVAAAPSGDGCVALQGEVRVNSERLACFLSMHGVERERRQHGVEGEKTAAELSLLLAVMGV